MSNFWVQKKYQKNVFTSHKVSAQRCPALTRTMKVIISYNWETEETDHPASNNRQAFY